VFSSPRIFLPIVLLLACLMGSRQVHMARQDTQTWDEALHIASGYSSLKLGDHRLDPEHPPLGRMLLALPIAGMKLRFETNQAAFQRADSVEMGHQLLYDNGTKAERILFRSRLVSIFMTLALGIILAFWCRWAFGAATGVFAAFLYFLDPNIAAHGHLATTDFAAVFWSFATIAALTVYLRDGGRRYLALTAFALGVGLASKYSCIFLIPVCAALYLFEWWQQRFSWRRALRDSIVMASVAIAIVSLSYGASGFQTPWKHPWSAGLGKMLSHQRLGHESYLLGELSHHGKWQYFPVVFAVKTPLSILVLCLFCLPFVYRHVRKLRVEWIALLLVLLVYWGLLLNAGINIGSRHMLPIYPFLFALCAAVLTKLAPRRYGACTPWLIAVCCLGLAVESARSFPHDIAFFNAAAGGRDNGYRYLVDSSLDWGQDLKYARRWFDERGTRSVCFNYFGGADLLYYGFPEWSIAPTEAIQRGERLSCRYGAISVTPLMGVYNRKEWWSWLRERTPIAKIGGSINIYDLRDVSDPREPLPQELVRKPRP
jgi:predicted membrane-bound dolichyl-phosphate-mannose-protein mannosyltransferase